MVYRISVMLVTGLLMVAAMSCGSAENGEEGTQTAARKPAYPLVLEDIIMSGETLTKITGDMTFDNTNSPCWVDGMLFFTNNNFNPAENSRTYRMNADGTIDTIQEDNGVVAAITPSGNGTLYACEMGGHRVIEMDYDGTVIRVVAGEYNGVRLDGPNDLATDGKGGIYFTDSRYSPGSQPTQDVPAVYYVTPGGEVIRVTDEVNFPNGVEVSPDGSTLFVTNTNGPDKGQFIFAWDINEDGTIANMRTFAEVQLTEQNASRAGGSSGADGSTIDSRGNLYVATNQGLGVQIFNAGGQYLGVITPGVNVNNCTFGGADLKTLYVTGTDGVYQIPTQIAGVAMPYGM